MRVSGPRASGLVSAITKKPLPPPRYAARRRFWGPDAIDDGLLLWFPGPASFTGEDVAELHVHGGRAVYRALADALAAAGGRPAEPGEFTRRAFHNGKLDLTQAEAIADLVAAETEGQRRQALRQLDGALGQLYEGWRARLIAMSARAEAAIDFPEEDLPDGLLAGVATDAAVLAGELRRHLDDGGRGERLREGFHVAILGAPNAGKSSLLNALVGRAAAIVHETAGTTRDIVEAAIDLNGWPVVFSDTAGLRVTADPVEAEGVRRAQERAGQADLKLLIFDGSTQAEPDAATMVFAGPRALLVANKSDLGLVAGSCSISGWVRVSAATGEGLGGLAGQIAAAAAAALDGSAPAPTRLRHRMAVETCIQHLDAMCRASLPELLVEDLRLAARALAAAVGRIDIEDVLDAVFREFCIGK
ncbi:tRNA modification GTPase MnmE [Allostella humosa]|uniref:tRNA uridine-5-carboxymethylaminomethyl(34) synthesis GTPase MnmE n=1 Tax=Stella humosa TaxID=94 RepID=UPI00113B11D1|nr:tRNA modification GTPase MnmE [Stella humosa]